MRWIALITLVLLCCDDSDPPGDGDADGDVDGDIDADDDGVIIGGPEDCPRNSGWPCTCDDNRGCVDGSRCAAAPGMTEGLGICSASCVPDDTSTQCPEDGFNAMGLCRISDSPWGDPTHCLLACSHDVPGMCPSDQHCRNLDISTDTDFCIP